MSSIISFGNVRMSGMGKSLITSYAALGVGLALVLTFGLTAISSINTQVYDSADRAVFTVTDPDAMRTVPAGPEQEMENKAMEAIPAEPPASTEAPEDVGAQTTMPSGTAGGGETAEAPMMQASPQEESAREGYLIATDTPAAVSSFAGILMALPYIAAAAVGSAVFVVTRKRVGW